MNLEQVKQFALAVGTRVESVTGGWAQCKCPLSPWTHDSGRDSHPSCAISYGNNIESVFNCFTCEAGDLFQMLEHLRGFGAKQPKYNLKAATDMWAAEESQDLVLDFHEGQEQFVLHHDVVWPELILDGFKKANCVPMAREYLDARNVSVEATDALGIVWDIARRAVCFPVRNWNGQLVGMRGRYVDPGEGARYHDYGHNGQRNKLPWYGEHLVDLDTTVLMVESVFDYTSARRVYPNILAPLSVGISIGKAKRVRDALDIVTLFDRGQGGDKGRDKISKYLGGTSLVRHLLPPEGVSDPGDMTKKQLKKVLKGHIMRSTTN